MSVPKSVVYMTNYCLYVVPPIEEGVMYEVNQVEDVPTLPEIYYQMELISKIRHKIYGITGNYKIYFYTRSCFNCLLFCRPSGERVLLLEYEDDNKEPAITE